MTGLPFWLKKKPKYYNFTYSYERGGALHIAGYTSRYAPEYPTPEWLEAIYCEIEEKLKEMNFTHFELRIITWNPLY